MTKRLFKIWGTKERGVLKVESADLQINGILPAELKSGTIQEKRPNPGTTEEPLLLRLKMLLY